MELIGELGAIPHLPPSPNMVYLKNEAVSDAHKPRAPIVLTRQFLRRQQTPRAPGEPNPDRKKPQSKTDGLFYNGQVDFEREKGYS